jgi:hypothetical protein
MNKVELRGPDLLTPGPKAASEEHAAARRPAKKVTDPAQIAASRTFLPTTSLRWTAPTPATRQSCPGGRSPGRRLATEAREPSPRLSTQARRRFELLRPLATPAKLGERKTPTYLLG